MKKTQKSGFTLIEVMVACLLLVVVLLGSASVSYRSGAGIQGHQDRREATIAANIILEKYWNMTYPDLQAFAGTSISISKPVNGKTLTGSVDFVQGSDCIEIALDLKFNNDSDSIQFATKRYKYGLSKAKL
ncbi:hypothetical protein PDESU_06141 [Pontiella desulfatans]|uniref:Type II secretion system protein I n=1 Tax=Pontiella desulfatans TaxID=2750659 RepID=A0A6C2UDU9_PONDE|nr:prepilin-type N-terminal cleavage/methylation domain-containing protein [Pontiella desulfatans]VGO17544.1 hypothetical protein PDESU_06141 [Pontiella desulfatans]